VLFVLNDRRLISGDSEGFLVLWDLGTQKKVDEIRAYDYGFTGLESDSSGEYCFSLGGDKTVKAWQLQPLKLCWSEKTTPTSAHCLTFCSSSQSVYFGLPIGTVWQIGVAHTKTEPEKKGL
jgi:WD40 repeat protein